jgi:hypothetical protein
MRAIYRMVSVPESPRTIVDFLGAAVILLLIMLFRYLLDRTQLDAAGFPRISFPPPPDAKPRMHPA